MGRNSRSDAAGREPPTLETLRDAIDGGRTGDKIRFPDPAAAPLGADDEAAGRPPSEQERWMAFAETARGRRPRGSGRLVVASVVAAVIMFTMGAILWVALSG